ncbi:HSP20 family protein [Ruminococcus sp. YE71]|uniref:Hsp20/alpha crystallin family protein n=1 Tax=unclassified Ruminococcus TaxID=2608920 RepID=UPI000880185F|nr:MULTISPECIES: Hsp20/alpha crystallin family protein [unclassified Ruminococcus]SDA27805.1 HSP20 family protein [Ruminococcus sp. YE78]SFW46254.1 HSP20 family protein [Ruminococcus sp. YE71]
MFAMTPFERHNDLFDEFERGFFGMPQRFEGFRTDIRDDGDKYVLEAELPGFEKEDIKLDITGDCMTLSAEHTETEQEGEPKSKYIRRERRYGSVSRSFDLTGIDKDGITAEYKSGILYMDLPKQQPQQPVSRRLEIR